MMNGGKGGSVRGRAVDLIPGAESMRAAIACALLAAVAGLVAADGGAEPADKPLALQEV